MKLTPRLRRLLRFQHTAFVVLFLAVIALAGWLTSIYSVQFDWTAGNRNTLSQASRDLLAEAEGPITITAYATERESLRQEIRRLVGRYQRSGSAEVDLEFIDPNAHPQLVREKGIRRDGQLTVSYRERSERVDQRSEQGITQAIQRVMRTGDRRIRFLTGHGERSVDERGRTGLSRFAEALRSSGVQVQALNLAETGEVPADTSLLVIADPNQALLEAEVEQIRTFVDAGGALLWLTEQEPAEGLSALADDLGLRFQEGTVVDPQARLLGMDDPTRVIIANYPDHPITRDFGSVTVFPKSSGLTGPESGDWNRTALLRTGSRAWLETGELRGELRYQGEQGDRKGPITLGVALQRKGSPSSDQGQFSEPSADADEASPAPPPQRPGIGSGEEDSPGHRLVVINDSDFLSNAFLGTAGNRDFALNTVNWLTTDEEFLDVRPKGAPDTQLRLPRWAAWTLPIAFLGGLPLLLFVAGAVVWLRRRHL